MVDPVIWEDQVGVHMDQRDVQGNNPIAVFQWSSNQPVVPL